MTALEVFQRKNPLPTHFFSPLHWFIQASQSMFWFQESFLKSCPAVCSCYRCAVDPIYHFLRDRRIIIMTLKSLNSLFVPEASRGRSLSIPTHFFLAQDNRMLLVSSSDANPCHAAMLWAMSRRLRPLNHQDGREKNNSDCCLSLEVEEELISHKQNLPIGCFLPSCEHTHVEFVYSSV